MIMFCCYADLKSGGALGMKKVKKHESLSCYGLNG